MLFRTSCFSRPLTPPVNAVAAPVASPLSSADRIEMFSSSPIRWNGRYSAVTRPEASVTTPYSLKQRAA
jgi:hypothetical protein